VNLLATIAVRAARSGERVRSVGCGAGAVAQAANNVIHNRVDQQTFLCMVRLAAYAFDESFAPRLLVLASSNCSISTRRSAIA
jgi:hypothetical protein